MDEVIKKSNNLEDKIRSVLAEQYPDIFKSILKLNGKTEKIYDAIVSVSNAANVIKLSCALKCLDEDLNVEKSINELYNYVSNPDRAFYVSTSFRKIILSNSTIAASIIGVMLGEIKNQNREFNRTDIILLNALENISDYDIRILYEMMDNKYTNDDIGREYIDEMKFPKDKKADFLEMLEFGDKYQIFGVFTESIEQEKMFFGKQYYKKPVADKLMNYIEQVKQILKYNI